MDLVLRGKTGTGESATGDSILGRRCFVSKFSISLVTKGVSYESAEYNGRVIKVVDGPGVGDTIGIEDLPKAIKLVIDAMQYAILLNPKGYHAFLLVITYGVRFTVDDKEVIRILKAIFGQDFVKNFCILIVTRGENFDLEERQQNGKTFKSWCREQVGTFQELLQECDNRAILFYNKTNNEAIKEKQMNKLMQTVDRLQRSGQRYSDENFQKAQATRESLLLEVKEPIIREETTSQLSIILQSIEKLSNENSLNKLQSLYELLKNTQDLYERIVETDKETGILNEILSVVKELEITLVNKIRESILYTEENGERMQIESDDVPFAYEQRKPLPESQTSQKRVIQEQRKNDNFQFSPRDEISKRKFKEARVSMDLLLLGKTGNGKSATGNSILGRDYFKSENCTTSVTNEVSYEHAEHNGRVIKVVDSPGVGDTSDIDDIEKATIHVMDAMQDAILLNPKGYHAFLLVVRYGARFTVEDKEVIRILKAIFGQDFVKNFCMLIVTRGENFDTEERQQNGKTFKSWCREQEGTFQELLQECDNRAILFYNKTNNEAIKEKQMNKLMQTVDRLQSRGQRYSDENFQRVHASRESLLLEVKEPIIREETSSQLSIILQSIEKLSNGNSFSRLQSLYELLKIRKIYTIELLKLINELEFLMKVYRP